MCALKVVGSRAVLCCAVQVRLSFSGTGEAAFAGVALFAHPDVACRCEAGYYLDVASAPVRNNEKFAFDHGS